jgi:hypothetical protein
MWGAYHGLLLIAARALARRIRVPAVVGWFATFNAVMLGWLLFMDTDAARIAAKARLLLTPASYSFASLRSAGGTYSSVEWFSVLLTVGMAGAVLLAEGRTTREDARQPYAALLAMPLAPALLAATLFLGAKTFSEFVYFAF